MSSEKKVQVMKDYMAKSVKPIFDKLITDLLLAMPSDVVEWSKKWLADKGTAIQNQINNKHLHTEEDDEDVIDESDLNRKKDKGKNRQGVSAEVYGEYNKKGDFKPRVVAKTEDQMKRIKSRMENSFMFAALDEKEQQIVIDAMEEKQFKAGEWIIKEGEEGNELYVIDQGEQDCFKQFSKDEEPKHLKTYKPGESFGELALLYNAPRAASIQAKSESLLFALDRATFNNIVKDAAVKKREQLEEILSRIELLQSMDAYERTQLGDGTKEVKYDAGQVVIQQGNPGDRIFMIIEGEFEATKVDKEGDAPRKVFEYKANDYFGELALLKNTPRQATVTAKTKGRLLYIDYETFQRMMGPLEDILKRNEDRYQKYVAK